jgi:hypothetical protein
MSASNRDDCRLQGMDLSVPARLRVIEGPQGVEITVGGRKVLNFCANNYLGLSSHPAVVHGSGATLGTPAVLTSSDGIAPGSIQISGQPIVLLADRQTTELPEDCHRHLADLPAGTHSMARRSPSSGSACTRRRRCG